MLLVNGSQADRRDRNKITLLKLSDIHKTKTANGNTHTHTLSLCTPHPHAFHLTPHLTLPLTLPHFR